MNVDEQLAWEKRMRPRGAVSAFAAGLLMMAGGIYSGVTFSESPASSFLLSLERAQESGPLGPLPSMKLEQYRWFDEHIADFFIANALSGLGGLAIAGALTFLAYATAARSERFPRAGLYLGVIGGVLLLVALMLVPGGYSALVGSVLDGPKTVDAVADMSPPTLLITGQLLELAARFTIGAALVVVSLNAMRAGLLTRFMGALGIIAGVLFAVPIFAISAGLPIVQFFWLIALGFLLLGVWPGGMPPAWRTGEAMPWPTAAQVRAQREAEKAGAPPPEEAPEQVAAGPSPATSRKKRKKRR